MSTLTVDVPDVMIGDGNWILGWEAEDPMAVLAAEITDPCGAGVTTEVLNQLSTSGVYRVMPFSAKAYLNPRPLTCGQLTDEQWTAKVLKDAAMRVACRGMCYEAAEGNETWIGDAKVTLTVPAFTGTAAQVAAGRKLWTDNNVGDTILHVADDVLPGLITAGVVIFDSEDEPVTIWGDEVHLNSGYLPGVLFFSGQFTVYLSSVETETLVSPSTNGGAVWSNILVAVDMSPYQIVRFGTVG